MLLPTFAGFATGFVLWGLSGAIMSGTFEALLYDDLVSRGAETQYARLVGWSHSSAMVANLVASVAAAPLYALGGYPLVGWTSVASPVSRRSWPRPSRSRRSTAQSR